MDYARKFPDAVNGIGGCAVTSEDYRNFPPF